MRILMVCLGNICRSPLAEGILQHLADSRALNWQVDSAGTGSWHVGDPPDQRSISVARLHGIDIGKQRGRQIRAQDLDVFDRIFVMDLQNQRDVLRLCQTETQQNKVELILESVAPGTSAIVPDPYYDDNAFEPTYQLLWEACTGIIERFS
ncbi:MAG: low molecular weight phosphotyrosine protein phosphatase [Bacteroidetes bacterium]|nr:low molecular weight phosphotyrosine protein phosphatase [Bacteroidota bacterium]